MATHSSILPCKILSTEEPNDPWGLQIVGHNQVTSTVLSEQLRSFCLVSQASDDSGKQKRRPPSLLDPDQPTGFSYSCPKHTLLLEQ